MGRPAGTPLRGRGARRGHGPGPQPLAAGLPVPTAAVAATATVGALATIPAPGRYEKLRKPRFPARAGRSPSRGPRSTRTSPAVFAVHHNLGEEPRRRAAGLHRRARRRTWRSTPGGRVLPPQEAAGRGRGVRAAAR
ncbi:hypothetical protein QJS66_12255 [Kocuria rhizophila]|nr:hypothetical protein QJS66_12255 [Kocuria rhizophila]